MIIAILEDDLEFLNHIKVMLNQLGYPNLLEFTNSKDFLSYKELSEIKLLFADYFLGRGDTFVDVLSSLKVDKNTKIIVITNYFESAVYNELKSLRNIVFLDKNFDKLALQNAIDVALNLRSKSSNIQFTGDQFFVRIGSNLKPLQFREIRYLKVDGKYINIHSNKDRVYAIRSTLTELGNKLPENFLRVHASVIINKNLVDSVSLKDKIVNVDGERISFSRTYRKALIESLEVI